MASVSTHILGTGIMDISRRSEQDLQHIKQKVWTTQHPVAERLAAAYYSVSFGGGIYCWIFCFAACSYLPILWPALLLYAAFLFSPAGVRPSLTAAWPTPFKRWGMWRLVQRYFNARLHKTAELPAGRSYIFAFHPHGVLSFGGWLTFATDALHFSTLFPGIDVRLLTLRINFRAPFLREYLLLHGVCDVSKQACLNILGRGRSIFIAVGGGTESLYAKPGAHELVLNRRKGFVKIALQTGAALVPVYCFGENNTFRTVNELPRESMLRRAQRRIEKATGFTIPLYFGTGLFLPFGFLAYPVQMDVVIAHVVQRPKRAVGARHLCVTIHPPPGRAGDTHSAEFEALVDKYHAAYVAGLRKLFEDNRRDGARSDSMRKSQAESTGGWMQ
eukprot:scaffold15.g4280.t1